jgi:hypothetical protein
MMHTPNILDSSPKSLGEELMKIIVDKQGIES